MTRIKEKEWFARHPQYKDIQHVCGIDRLMDTMISLLAEKMVTEIPILVREMRKRKVEVNKWRGPNSRTEFGNPEFNLLTVKPLSFPIEKLETSPVFTYKLTMLLGFLIGIGG